MGQTQLNKLLYTLDLPGLQGNLFKKHERLIGPIVENVAKDSCAEAALLERQLTIKNVEDLKKLL